MRASGLALFGALLLSGCQSLLVSAPDDSFNAATLSEQTVASDALQFPTLDDGVEQLGLDSGDGSPAGELVAGWSLEEKIASLFLVHIAGTSVADFEQAASSGLAGFLVLRSNVPGDAETSRPFLSAVRTLSDPELLIAIDQEGGAVQRLRPDPFPSPSELGELGLSETADATRQRNQLVFDAGANVNLGIIADVSPGEDAYIHERSFGTDPVEVSQFVEAAVGGDVGGVATAVKHFPGHGLTPDDTHDGVAHSSISYDNWLAQHALPFQIAIDDEVPLLMFGHLVVDSVDSEPASLSPEWVSLVRDQWAYDGVLITDDLSMLENAGDDDYADFATNATNAIAAGMDLIIDAGGTSINAEMNRVDEAIAAISAAVQSGAISQDRIDAAATRVVSLRYLLGGVSRPLENADAG